MKSGKTSGGDGRVGRTERMEEEESLKAGKPPVQVSGEPDGQLGLERPGGAELGRLPVRGESECPWPAGSEVLDGSGPEGGRPGAGAGAP